MFGACFFCGAPANTERGDICQRHENMITARSAEILRTQPEGKAARIKPPEWLLEEMFCDNLSPMYDPKRCQA